MGDFVVLLALIQTGLTAIMLGVLVFAAIRVCLLTDRYSRSDDAP